MIKARYIWGDERVERIEFSLTGAAAKLLPPPTPKTVPRPVKPPCVREMDEITMLQPWERYFLELVIAPVDKAAFAAASLWIGTRTLAHPLIPQDQKIIVLGALSDPSVKAITLCPNVWFRRPFDSRRPDDLALLVHEAVHLADCHLAGLGAYIVSYLEKAIATGNYADIPDERRANRFEEAARKLLMEFPDLASIISSCDNDAIMRELKARADTYRAAKARLL